MRTSIIRCLLGLPLLGAVCCLPATAQTFPEQENNKTVYYRLFSAYPEHEAKQLCLQEEVTEDGVYHYALRKYDAGTSQQDWVFKTANASNETYNLCNKQTKRYISTQPTVVKNREIPDKATQLSASDAFTLTPIGDGQYTISYMENGERFMLAASNSYQGTQPSPENCKNTQWAWRICKSGAPLFMTRYIVHSSRNVLGYETNGESGDRAAIKASTDGTVRPFTLKRLSDGSYNLCVTFNSQEMYLSLSDQDSYTTVYVTDGNDNRAKYQLEDIGGGYVKFKNVSTNKYLGTDSSYQGGLVYSDKEGDDIRYKWYISAFPTPIYVIHHGTNVLASNHVRDNYGRTGSFLVEPGDYRAKPLTLKGHADGSYNICLDNNGEETYVGLNTYGDYNNWSTFFMPSADNDKAKYFLEEYGNGYVRFRNVSNDRYLGTAVSTPLDSWLHSERDGNDVNHLWYLSPFTGPRYILSQSKNVMASNHNPDQWSRTGAYTVTSGDEYALPLMLKGRADGSYNICLDEEEAEESYLSLSFQNGWSTYFAPDDSDDKAKYYMEELGNGYLRFRNVSNNRYLGTDNTTPRNSWLFSDKNGTDPKHLWFVSPISDSRYIVHHSGNALGHDGNNAVLKSSARRGAKPFYQMEHVDGSLSLSATIEGQERLLGAASGADGTTCYVQDDNAGSRFYIEKHDEDYVRLRNASTGKYLGTEDTDMNADVYSNKSGQDNRHLWNFATATRNEYDLADATDYVNKEIDRDCDIVYTREFDSTNWQALYIPFSLNYDEWCQWADIAEINNVHQSFGENEETLIEFRTLTHGSTLPNTPYLIRPKNTGSIERFLQRKTLQEAEEGSVNCASTRLLYELTGVYEPYDEMDGKYSLNVNGSQFTKETSNANVLEPQRFYLEITPRNGGYGSNDDQVKAPARVKLMVDGLVTGIEVVTVDPSGTAYNLQGLPAGANSKEIVIINGKRILRR